MIKEGRDLTVMSGKDGEFEALRRDLEIKSNQIENLKMEIKQHKEMMGLGEGSQFDPKSRLSGTNPGYDQINSNLAKRFNNSMFDIQSENVTSEVVVRQFQHQIGDLQRKLNLMTDLCKEQDEKYQKSYRDMESKLRRALHSRDELLQLRQAESNNQQKLINQLQHGLEAFDKDKTDRDNKITTLNDALSEKNEQYNMLKGKSALLEKNLQTIVTMLIPDLRKTAIDNVLDISIENVPKYLERFLSLNDKQREDLSVDCKDLSHKVEEEKRNGSEMIQHEKEAFQMKMKEIENLHKTTLETKQREVENLEDEIDKVNDILREKDTCYEKEMKVLKRTIDENKEKSLYNMNSLKKERDMLNNKLLEMESNVNIMHQEKLKAINDYKDVSEKMEVLSREVQTAKQHILSLESNNHELKNAIRELQTTLQSIKTMAEVEKAHFQGEINMKAEQCSDLLKREKEWKEKFESLSSTVENKVKEEERRRYQNELNEINIVVENYKGVLEQAKNKICDKEIMLSDAYQQLEEKVSALESSQNTIETLRQDLQITQKVVEEKDNSLVSTLLQIDSVKQKLKDSEKECATLQDVISVSDEKLKSSQNLIENLEKDKLELRQQVEKNDFKLTLLQQEWDNILNGLNEKNNTIKTLQKEKKSVAKKLKEKHEKLLSCEHDLTKQNENCEKHCQEFKHLQGTYDELTKRCLQLEKALEDMQMAQNKLKRKPFREEDEKERIKELDVIQILQKLDLSDSDLVSLRKLLSDQKSKDYNILKIATTNQKVVTKQRADLDNLKTKIQWLKEALDVSELARKDLEKGLLIKNEQLVQQIEQLQKLQQENEKLTVYLNQSHFEIKRLHMALEKTYSGVHTLVERQENAIKQASNFPYPKYQETMSRLNPDKISSQNVAKPYDKNGEEEDIRFLLKEMKDLLFSALKDKQLKLNVEFSNDDEQKTVRENVADEISQRTTNDNHAQTTILGRNSKLLDDYLERHSTENSSNNTLLFLTKETNTLNDGGITINEKSPLLRTSSPKSVNSSIAGSLSIKSEQSDVLLKNTDGYTDNLVETEQIQDAATTLERLQDKLINLKDMGVALTSNNKTISNMMKKHSKKLRSIKDDVNIST